MTKWISCLVKKANIALLKQFNAQDSGNEIKEVQPLNPNVDSDNEVPIEYPPTNQEILKNPHPTSPSLIQVNHPPDTPTSIPIHPSLLSGDLEYQQVIEPLLYMGFQL